MPEGDTIHKIAAAMRPALLEQRVHKARLRLWPAGTYRRGGPAASADATAAGTRIEGQVVREVFARGKHLFVAFDEGLLLRSHLGMYGSWHRYRPAESWRKPEWQASIALWTCNHVFVCFNAKEVELIHEPSIRHANFSNRLGPDLLAEDLDLELVVDRARQLVEAETPLADLLLDQRVACGVGNVYKSEVLFMEGRDPLLTVGVVPDGAIRGLYQRACSLLLRNLGGGRRVTRFSNDGQGRLWVYARQGAPCFRCGAEIRCGSLGRDRRSTYWCPACQAGANRASVRNGKLPTRRPPGYQPAFLTKLLLRRPHGTP
jgi:endonuclease-8